MFKLYAKQFSFLITAIFSFIIGLLIIIQNVNVYHLAIKLLTVLIFLRGITFLFHEKNFLSGIVNIIIAFIFNFFPNIPLSFLPILVSFYLIILSLINMLTFYFYTKDGEKYYLIPLFKAIFFLLLAFPLLFTPLISLQTLLITVGIYVVVFGFFNLFDFLGEAIPQKTKIHMKRRIRITLPLIITTFVPYTIIKHMNEYLSVEEKELKIPKKNKDFDLEVLIHVSENGTGAFGHVDLYYKGKIISYGNYDMKSRHFKEAMGDGVLFIVENKQAYLDFCNTHSHKTLFGFGLKLSKEQQQRVDLEIKKLEDNLIEWIPYYKRAIMNKEKIKKDDYNDYVSSLYKKTKAKFYKFKKGKFKTFLILSTNCVQLADTILGKAGLDIIKATGLISPGTYYDYLLREYYKKNSFVVSYNIYHSQKK